MQLILGFFLSLLIGLLAWRFKALSQSGALAAVLSGGLIFGLGGLPWATLLLTFFISSSVLSRAFNHHKRAVSEKFAKGSQRDWGQVLANGGLGAFLALAYYLSSPADWAWVAFSGAMAAVNADTWATELGVLSPHRPRLITSGKKVERGTSGGVSLVGSLASLGGALLVAILAWLFSPAKLSLQPDGLILLFASTIGGMSGSFIDSLIGATVQAIYYCPACEKETERNPLHLCGTQTVPLRGWCWLNNDWVNFVASLTGAITTLIVWYLLI